MGDFAIKSYKDGDKATVSAGMGGGKPPDTVTDKFGNDYRRIDFPNPSGAASISPGGLNYLYTRCSS